MSDPIISVRNLGKKYRLGATLSHNTLRDQITYSVKSLWYHLQSTSDGQRANNKISPFYSPTINSEFWALKDISFDVMQGEIVGIIGRNGAGKSTLLKILSQITEPTKGEARIRGRVASLLEVGTGFHPELSGRENIFLNGAILGMTKKEIKAKFDEIVAFAEIEKFIDTPVKRYSSGMYVRLAFAVAAHLEPEILLVDEVLAVGDAAFQKKCLEKMGDVTKEGRTVLFVSHNMGAILQLCSRAIVLEMGKIFFDGASNASVNEYLRLCAETGGSKTWDNRDTAPGDDQVILRGVRLVDDSGKPIQTVEIRCPFNVEIEYEVLRSVKRLRVYFRLLSGEGIVVLTSADRNEDDCEGTVRQPGVYVSRCRVPGNLLNSAQYFLSVFGDIPFIKMIFKEENILEFQVQNSGGVSGVSDRWDGVICPKLEWLISPKACTEESPA